MNKEFLTGGAFMQAIVIEDEAQIRRGIVNCVDWIKYGFENVLEASNGETGLELIKKEKPSVVLLDICLPKISGIELLEKLKSEAISTRIIILSGYDYFEYAQKAISFGVDAYLLKPASPEKIERELEKIFRPDLIFFSQNETLKKTNSDKTINEPYPYADEKKLLENLRASQYENSVLYFNKIVEYLRAQKGTDMAKTAKSRLLNIIRQMYNIVIELDGDICDAFGSEDQIEKCSNFEKIGQFKEMILDMIQNLCKYIDKKLYYKYNPILRQILLHIEENYKDLELSLSSISEMLNMNSSYVSQFFKKHKGETLMAYIIRYRIEKSKALLAATDMKILDIALEVGFSDSHYFAIRFKNLTGITPTDFRSRYN